MIIYGAEILHMSYAERYKMQGISEEWFFISPFYVGGFMCKVSFKERVRDEAVTNARLYKKNYGDTQVEIWRENWRKKEAVTLTTKLNSASGPAFWKKMPFIGSNVG